jgi:hypothetical protein
MLDYLGDGWWGIKDGERIVVMGWDLNYITYWCSVNNVQYQLSEAAQMCLGIENRRAA